MPQAPATSVQPPRQVQPGLRRPSHNPPREQGHPPVAGFARIRTAHQLVHPNSWRIRLPHRFPRALFQNASISSSVGISTGRTTRNPTHDASV
ncbi:hypothetical protein [Rhodopirellula baltica]